MMATSIRARYVYMYFVLGRWLTAKKRRARTVQPYTDNVCHSRQPAYACSVVRRGH